MSFDRISGGRFPTYMRQSLLPAGPRTMPLDMTEDKRLTGKFATDKQNTTILEYVEVYTTSRGISPTAFKYV